MKKITQTATVLLLCAFAKTSQAQEFYSVYFSSQNQAYRPSGNGSLSNDSLLNTILTKYEVFKFQKAYNYSIRPEASNEFVLYTNRDGDSLKNELQATNQCDSVINFGQIKTSSCTTPVIVNDPKTFTMDNWGIEKIDAKCAWSITKGDPRVIPAWSDTEFDETHEDFADKIAYVWHSNPSYTGAPLEYHGTKVASVAVANTNNNIGISGVAYNIKGAMYSCDDNWGPTAGLEKAYYDGRKILNCSWTSTGLTAAYAKEMTDHGVVLLTAAGNYVVPSDHDHQNIANIPGVINVSSTDKYDYHGPTTVDHNAWVDLCAPGGNMLRFMSNTDPGTIASGSTYNYAYFKSTSTSVSVVTAIVSLMLSVNPCLSPSEVEYILKQTCDPIVDNSSYPGQLGAGRVNAYRAVKFAQETSCMNILGIDINTVCRPGKVSGVPNPQFTVKMEGGTPPYNYKWEPLDYTPGAGIWNTTTLDDYTIGNPTVTSSTTLTTTGYHIAYYRLIVTDASAVKKMAIRTIKVMLSNELTPIVAMRDSYMDMLREPNDQKEMNPYDIDTWTSPDVWNRQIADGIEKHENPEYFISAPNHVYTRIRNYGCVASTEGQKLKLYWSKAATGEKWEADWKTTNVKDVSGALTMPGGREITPSTGIAIPILAPTATTILNYDWNVPKPQDYEGAPDNFDACVLARIEKSPTYPHGMTNAEALGLGVGNNVRANNTIVTRNLVLTNLNTTDFWKKTREVLVGNADDVAQVFNVRFEADRPIYPNFGGDFSTRGSVILHLGTLYDRWITAGGTGEFTSRDENARTVTMQGNSLLSLDNIEFAPSERFTIQVEFLLDTNVSITDSSFQRMHLRQYLASTPDSLYGAVGYELKINPASQNNQRKVLNDSITTGSTIHSFKVAPNPTSGIVRISFNGEKDNATQLLVTDMVGKKVMTEKMTFSPGSSKEINLARFAAGTYIINISNANGTTEAYKVVKE